MLFLSVQDFYLLLCCNFPLQVGVVSDYDLLALDSISGNVSNFLFNLQLSFFV